MEDSGEGRGRSADKTNSQMGFSLFVLLFLAPGKIRTWGDQKVTDFFFPTKSVSVSNFIGSSKASRYTLTPTRRPLLEMLSGAATLPSRPGEKPCTPKPWFPGSPLALYLRRQWPQTASLDSQHRESMVQTTEVAPNMAPRLKVTLRALNNGNMTGPSPKITVCRVGPVGFKSTPMVPSPGQDSKPMGLGSREIAMRTKRA